MTCEKMPGVPFAGLDIRAVSRSLAQIADAAGDLTDAYFERLEEVEVAGDGRDPSVRTRREEGCAVRLVRGRRCWLATRDEIEPEAVFDAIRQVARAVPQATYTTPEFRLEVAAPSDLDEWLDFPRRVDARVREMDAAFPFSLRFRRHRRETLVIGPRLAADPQLEVFGSCESILPWGRFGALLAGEPGESADCVAAGLVGLFRARNAKPPPPSREVVLGPSAAAVVLHEAVAHALEVDTLGLTGKPEAAIGVRLAGPTVHVLDDPASAPPSVRRSFDDEGAPVTRRWLLRDGVVEQPLADGLTGRDSSALIPGSGRRGSRHDSPRARSTHLELLAGDRSIDDLCSDGLYVEQVERGSLDPLSGRFEVVFPWARRLRGGRRSDYIGRCRLRAGVAELLSAVVGVGRHPEAAGAGWCAKGGQRLPVWATTPAVRLEGVEVAPA